MCQGQRPHVSQEGIGGSPGFFGLPPGLLGPAEIGQRVGGCVGNLHFSTQENELRTAFEAYGNVSSCSVVKDKFSGDSRGFGFVEMPNATEAKSAINGLSGSDLNGRDLTVNEAKPREERGSRSGFGGGGRGSDSARRPFQY